MTSTIGLPRDKLVKRNNKIAGVDDLSISGLCFFQLKCIHV